MKLTAFSYLDTHALDSKAIHLRPVEKNLCDARSLKSKCTSGRAVNQRFDEEHHDRVRSCCRIFPYETAQRKHKAGIVLLFTEAGRGTVRGR